MRILLLADINSAHTRKWVEALLKHEGLELGLYSLSAPQTDQHKRWRIPVQTLGLGEEVFQKGTLGKLHYLRAVPGLRKFIKAFKPDVVHAHYASSYGLLGYLTSFRPFALSVWGSDVQDFPNRGKMQKLVLKTVLGGTDAVYSTSKAMQNDLQRHFEKDSELIPFGILADRFKAVQRTNEDSFIRFGTVKSLEEVYGIDILIKAYASFSRKYPEIRSELKIFGKGSMEADLRALAESLDLSDKVKFMGFVDPVEVPKAYAELDVFLALSRRESFGVVVLEAQAAALPVIVSQADGFQEVMEPGVSGYRVNIKNEDEIVEAMNAYTNTDLRIAHGKAGQDFVSKHFDFRENVESQIKAYKKLLGF